MFSMVAYGIRQMLSFFGFGYYCWALKFHCKEQNWSTKCQIHLIWLDFNLDNEHPLAIQISHRKCIEQLKIQKKFKVDALQIAILPRHTSGFSGFVLVLVSLHKVDGIDKHGPNLFGCFLFVGWWARTWMQICWQKTHVNIFFVNYIYIYIHINILCTSMSLHTLPKNKSFSHMDMNIKRYTYTKFILYVVFNLVLFF